MTIRSLSEIRPHDQSNWTLRTNRTLADAGLSAGGFEGARGDRKVFWFAAIGWIGLLADIVWRLL